MDYSQILTAPRDRRAESTSGERLKELWVKGCNPSLSDAEMWRPPQGHVVTQRHALGNPVQTEAMPKNL